MPRFRIDSPKGVHQPPGKYSHAARAEGPLIVIAGQVALDIDGALVGENDVAAQTRQVFRNMEAVLAGSGSSFANVVEFTYYVVGRENLQGFMATRTAIFDGEYPDGDYPPATLLVVSGLANESFLVEVSALAAT